MHVGFASVLAFWKSSIIMKLLYWCGGLYSLSVLAGWQSYSRNRVLLLPLYCMLILLYTFAARYTTHAALLHY